MKKLFVVLVFFTAVNYAVTLKVPQDYTTIQSAINAANTGDTVLVSPGTYFENIIFRGKDIVVTSNYIFSRNPADINNTIINGSQPSHPDSASCVRIVSHETSAAQLLGFTITGGKGTKWIDEHGAGVYTEGGGILITLSSPVIRYNRIINNVAINKKNIQSAGGGGIRVGDGNPLIEGNFIAWNKGRYGAGLVLNFTGATVLNNIFYQNTGGEDFGGGGIWVLASGPAEKKIVNNTIVGNVSTLKGGGGLYIWDASVVLKNNLIYGNTGGETPAIALVSSGSVSATYNFIEGGYDGEGNISGDPGLQSDFRLNANSICMDGGDPDTLYNDLEDILNPGFAKSPSLGMIRNDIGAFGGPAALTFYDILSATEEEDRSDNHPDGFKLEQNYPNPFNPETRINFTIPTGNTVELKIFNLLGEEVAVLLSDYKPAGSYSIAFDASNLNSGIYIGKLSSGSFSSSLKMCLVK